jgi:hypothetical protein
MAFSRSGQRTAGEHADADDTNPGRAGVIEQSRLAGRALAHAFRGIFKETPKPCALSCPALYALQFLPHPQNA